MTSTVANVVRTGDHPAIEATAVALGAKPNELPFLRPPRV
jgi:hypothetical protein